MFSVSSCQQTGSVMRFARREVGRRHSRWRWCPVSIWDKRKTMMRNATRNKVRPVWMAWGMNCLSVWRWAQDWLPQILAPVCDGLHGPVTYFCVFECVSVGIWVFLHCIYVCLLLNVCWAVSHVLSFSISLSLFLPPLYSRACKHTHIHTSERNKVYQLSSFRYHTTQTQT